MPSLDVGAGASVRACVDTGVEGAGRLDVLIKNAGHKLAGALEELSFGLAGMERDEDLIHDGGAERPRRQEKAAPRVRAEPVALGAGPLRR